MYSLTDGPWREGDGVNCSVMGSYVTIVASSPDLAHAIAEFLGGTNITPSKPMMIGHKKPDQPRERRKLTHETTRT